MNTSSTTRSRGTSRFSYHQVATPWQADCVARARIHAASSTVMPLTGLASAGAEPDQVGDACDGAIGHLLTDRGDLRVGRGISMQEPPHERILLDELEVARDAGAKQLLGRCALEAAQRAFPQLLGVQFQKRDVEFALGAEMVIQHRGHDTGARRDVLHLRLIAVFGEYLDGRVEDANAPLLGRYPPSCHTEY